MNTEEQPQHDPKTETTPTATDTHILAVEKVDPELSDQALRDRLQIPDWRKIESYGDLRMIGMGGIGTVFAAREPVLFRNVAIKILRQENRRKASALDSLLREARMTAQIDHPNVVPVYSLGVFDDVGAYFTMKRVAGRTLSSIIRSVAAGKTEYAKEYSLRRMLEIFLSVCNGVAFAHSKGIIHRDLKPGNVMLGDYGEVLVMDWGMALYRSENDSGKGAHRIDLPEQELASPDPNRKIVSGTPAYMSPEQVLGNLDGITEKSDQYSLGAILYSILTLQPAPFDEGERTDKLLGRVLRGDFEPPRKRSRRRRVPRELEAICLKAMANTPEKRYHSVAALRDDVRNYLDMYPVDVYNSPLIRLIKYCRRRPLIPAMLAGAILSAVGLHIYNAIDHYNQYNSLYRIATANIDSADVSHRKLHRTITMHRTVDGIRDSSDARLDMDFFTGRLGFLSAAYAAFNALEKASDAGLPEKQFRPEAERLLKLMLCYYNTSGDTEALRNFCARFNPRMKEAFHRVLIADSALALRTQMVLAGKSKISITAPAHEKISAEYYETPESAPVRIQLGAAPYFGKLPGGVYVFEIDENGRNIRIPIDLRAGESYQVNFTVPPHFPDDAVLIGAGAYYTDISGVNNFGRRQRTDAFLLGRHEVTFDRYREFWKTLPPDLREKYLPRIIRGAEFIPVWDTAGKLIAPYTGNMPVVGVSVEAAQAYCRAEGEKFGLTGRLPRFRELEKAARGPDRRIYVWGNDLKSGGAMLRNPAKEEYTSGAAVGSFADDRSLYDVYDLTGNVREMAYSSKEQNFVAYGGSFSSPVSLARCGATSPAPAGGAADLGFRCVYELPKTNEPVEKNDEK